MKILFLAPEPFFQDRGTPIAVRLALQVLASRGSDGIDLLTYHEGRNIEIPNVQQRRIKPPFPISSVGPGISLKKLVCDVLFLWSAFRMVWKKRRAQYDLVHAVEESVFIAWLIKLFFGIPYIYDMDSSLALQVTEKWSWSKPLAPVLDWFERAAVRGSTAVVPVCDALAAIADRHGSRQTQILRDISLLDLEASSEDDNTPDVRAEANIPQDSCVALYIGNLEPYQGIDLLIDSFAEPASQFPKAHLIIIGGMDAHVTMYREKVTEAGLADRVHLIGQRPLASLSSYLLQADILASPRIRGNNTPMKIYSYLHSGKAIIATKLPTHTQVMDSSVALLAEPRVAPFSAAMHQLLESQSLREQVGTAARDLAERKYTYEVFSRDLNALYDSIGAHIAPEKIKVNSQSPA